MIESSLIIMYASYNVGCARRRGFEASRGGGAKRRSEHRLACLLALRSFNSFKMHASLGTSVGISRIIPNLMSKK